MTRIVLPSMKERGRGAIVNIGSAAGSVVPSTPLVSVYAGTKVSTYAHIHVKHACLLWSLDHS